jgi:DNA-binding GntR family transcriptional regulator
MTELDGLAPRPAALTDWAYETIKKAILNLEFAMGAQLNIEELAETMQISRTPVREALLRLEKDGLVQAVPRVGFFIVEITRTDLEELFELRALLESYATKRAAPLLTDEDLDEIEDLLELSCAAVDVGDFNGFLKYEIALHEFITDHAQNRRLKIAMGSLEDLTYRERIISIRSEENVRASCVEHERIVQALRQGDAELAGTRMWEHIWAVRERMLQYVDSLDAGEEPVG